MTELMYDYTYVWLYLCMTVLMYGSIYIYIYHLCMTNYIISHHIYECNNWYQENLIIRNNNIIVLQDIWEEAKENIAKLSV